MSVQATRAGRVHAFTSEDPEARVAGHMAGLELFCSRPDALARALRAIRKAAFRGTDGYDPARHAALLRLARVRGLARPGGEGWRQEGAVRGPAHGDGRGNGAVRK